MKTKVRIYTCAILLIPLMASAQENAPNTYKNSIKINLPAMVLNNVSFLYERNLSEHWSLQAGAGYRWGGDIPKAFGLGNLVLTANSQGIRGFNITPEVRYYFNLCDCGKPNTGLYAGLYGRFTRLFGDLDLYFWREGEYVDVATFGSLRELGVGLQIGYQFVLKERFIVDLMFAGPRVSSNKIKFSIDSDYLDEVLPLIEDEINEKREWFGMDPISMDSSADLETKFSFGYFRYAIGFGILF